MRTEPKNVPMFPCCRLKSVVSLLLPFDFSFAASCAGIRDGGRFPEYLKERGCKRDQEQVWQFPMGKKKFSTFN